MSAPIHLIPKDGEKNADGLLTLIEERDIAGTLYAADFYIEGAHSWEAVPGGWRHESGRIVNVDHHAPDARMRRHVSSANLALELLAAGEGPVSGDAVAISHIDCDSILSAGLLSGRLEACERYGSAAIAADHTGEEDAIADLLQGLDAHWSWKKGGAPDLRTVEYLFECLDRLERGESLPDAFAREALEHRARERNWASKIAKTMTTERGVATAFLEREAERGEGRPIGGELFLPHARDAWLVASATPLPDHPDRWRWRVRLGRSAPRWLSLHDLGLTHFDPVFGGRWNAGSNNRPSSEGGVPGSPLPPQEYHDRLVAALDARRLERAIQIAVQAHLGQRDKAGAPYITHSLRVMAACRSVDARIVGVLHDVVEDSEDWTLQRIADEGFSGEVIAGLVAVTKRPEEQGSDEGYMAFCRRAAEHPIGREVKRADLLDNMDASRLPSPSDADRERVRRYEKALELMEGKATRPPTDE